MKHICALCNIIYIYIKNIKNKNKNQLAQHNKYDIYYINIKYKMAKEYLKNVLTGINCLLVLVRNGLTALSNLDSNENNFEQEHKNAQHIALYFVSF